MIVPYGPRVMDEFWAEDQASYHAALRGLHEAVADQAVERLPKENLMLHVVDVGCGAGRLLKLIHEKHQRPHVYMTGIDFSYAALQAAYAHFDWPLYLQRDIASHDFRISLSCGAADVVVCCLALDFIPDVHTAICNMAALLDDGGHLLLVVKDGSALRDRLDAHRWTLAQFDSLCQMFGGRATRLFDFYLMGEITK